VREQHLLDVAADVFATLGFHGTSLERVARDADVSRQYVAKLFGDKTGLYVACHKRARQRLDQALASAATPPPAGSAASPAAARATVESVAAAYFGFVAHEGASWDVLFAGGPSVDGSAADEIAAMRAHTIGLLARLIRSALPGVDDRDAVFSAEAMSGAAAQHAHTLRREDEAPSVAAERFTRLFWSGLAALHADATA
jgi:AcrR family transcriptional regulator